MQFWLDLGRRHAIDAVPYLIEREGTINENFRNARGTGSGYEREMDRPSGSRIAVAEA